MNQAHFRAFITIVAVGLAFGVAACGSDPNTAPAGPGGSSGVTIQGTVNGGTASAADVSSQSATSASGLTVTVEGTNLSTTTNGRGEFTIVGAPSGTVVLRFRGPGADARLELAGLSPGQTIRITVTVSGNHAERDDNKAEIRGLVEALLSPSSLRVDGTIVVVTADTEIKKNNGRLLLSEVRVGDTVRVQGMVQADGSILAREIRLEGRDGGEGAELEFEGAITALQAPNLTVDGRTVRTDSRTKFHSHGIDSLSDLRVGDRVEIQGLLQSDSTVYAQEVKKR